ncbi:MAG: ABC transporter ATP-binding protein [Prevotella sp.]|nr:ABC transporter ATP-binding protein [Prevotella sp.]MDY2633193.1 ABC transporter ATP-binding protein [Prevotella sp.]
MVEVNNITFRYQRKGQPLFDNFSIRLEDGHVYGLLGKNGTGKSTLLYLISGLLYPQRGDIRFMGNDVRSRLPENLGDMFIVPEEYDLPPMSLSNYIRANRPFYPKFSDEVLRSCLEEFEMPADLNLKELSMGQKKKVYLSIALAAGTRLLLMDEPTNGLDIPSKMLFRRVVANHLSDERTLLLSTHQVHDVETLLDHVMILDRRNLLLDASMAELTSRYRFVYTMPGESAGEVLYAEPTLQGNASLLHRRDGDEETQVNLELLFNAVNEGKLKHDSLSPQNI